MKKGCMTCEYANNDSWKEPCKKCIESRTKLWSEWEPAGSVDKATFKIGCLVYVYTAVLLAWTSGFHAVLMDDYEAGAVIGAFVVPMLLLSWAFWRRAR